MKLMAAKPFIPKKLAEREGFEPPIPFQVCRFSRPVPSTARPPLRLLQFYYSLPFGFTFETLAACGGDPSMPAYRDFKSS